MSTDLFADAPVPIHGIRTGIGGWTFKPWRDNFYPAGLVQKRELEYASRHLTAIEINGTFYGAQKPATYARWRSETPEGFVFSLKAPRYCTDAKRLAGAGKSIEGFVFGGLAELGDRLGPILWQFDPRRAFDRDDFAAFLELLPRELDGAPLRHVLEVRHPSFACPEYLALARQHRLPTVFTDSPDYPSFADLTGDFVYARLMRSRERVASGYPDDELDAWARRARAWAAGGAPEDLPTIGAERPPARPREVFVYFIGAAKARNPAAAMALQARLQDA
ncbi:DUF72 domain-containing protein [Luteimonas sp. RD2P54]|uniref:DUF72 domain-containing protein n=1 Tax=Luteimonas endophytica TaxID=3042023 RepID=A0ABT6JCN0_9GAMM|nr:DUF72 domain-containing protein [Luteimonas endophytica]MDH5824595.1 DUF72 domain-containing protein [Luteimonas endophytica]